MAKGFEAAFGAALADDLTLPRTDWQALPPPKDHSAALLEILASPNVASKEWIYRQYDHNVRHGTLLAPCGNLRFKVASC